MTPRRGATTLRAGMVAGYLPLAWWLTRDGPSLAGLWWLTLVGMFCVVYILAADWVAAGRKEGPRADLPG